MIIRHIVKFQELEAGPDHGGVGVDPANLWRNENFHGGFDPPLQTYN
jgi:hypothetical protein